jgi:quercetin dioxygenase-like cupin family protein
MNHHPSACKRLLIVAAPLIFATQIHYAAAQQPPTERKGVTGKALTAIDLGPEISGMEGRALRMRMTTVAPGGTIGLHDHKDRPSIVYVLQGTLIEYKDGGTKELNQGDVISQGKDHSHALENRGASPAIFIEAEVIRKE